MAQAPLDSPPLTLVELRELLGRHLENAAVAQVINEAIERRLAEAGQQPRVLRLDEVT